MILDSKSNRFVAEARGLAGCDSRLINFMTKLNLVNRFHLDHPRWEMWMWTCKLHSISRRFYLYRVIFRRADKNFVSCPMFRWVRLTNHKMVVVSLLLINMPRLTENWKFNNSLLEIQDFWNWLENLIQSVLVGPVTGNRWWEPLKQRISDFTVKYSQQLTLDNAKSA